MRADVTRDRIGALMRAIAEGAPRAASYRVYLLGGGTAVWVGWRATSIDADLFAPDDAVFGDIQSIKKQLNMNIEFVRPEHFVPALPGSDSRHVFIQTLGRVSYYHYDPYAQVLAKVVRGFDRDMADAEEFVRAGLVVATTLSELVAKIPDSEYARYPNLSPEAVREAVAAFVAGRR